MKYHNLLVIASFIILFSCDNEEFSPDQALSFIKYYGSNKPYAGVQVLTGDDGGYIVLGNFENPGRGQDICLVKTDKYGNTTGPVLAYGGLFDDFGYAISKNDAGYIIAGSTKASRLGDKNVYLIQINTEGDTLWTSAFGGDYDDEAFDVLVMDNGELVLTGYTNVSDNNSDLLVAKTSSSGEKQWFWGRGYDKNEYGNTIVEAGNYFVIGGSTNSRPVGSTTYNKFLVQVTKEGTNPSPNYYVTNGDSEIASISVAGDNTYFAVCNIESVQRDESEIECIKFRHDSRDRIEIIWTKFFGEQLFNKVEFSRVKNNSLILAGTSGTNIETGDLLLVKLDMEGNTPEYAYKGDGVSFSGSGFDFTSDGGYIISGSNYSGENSVIALAKLNAEGK
ncbi:MAG: hypothetical protein JXB24_06625 [Bacteroidales bacterium]|nr:hypothetical protein [Bacteroidales bacterium]